MKILTIGSALIDTIAVIASERIERMVMRNADTSFLLIEEGRKSEAQEVSTHCGGGAVNTAVAMSRLGHDVAALVKVGQDERAESIMARLKAEGVSTRFVLRDGRAPTGASVLISAHDRNAAIFTFRGANTLLEPKDLPRDAFATGLVYISSLSNESANCFPVIIEKAKKEGALVATNPGIRQLSSKQGDFRASLAKIDILAINRVEAGALIPWLVGANGEGGPELPVGKGGDLPELAKVGLAGGGFEMSLLAFFRAMHKLGPKWILVSDGKNGAYLGTQNSIIFCPAQEVKVAGTAGAGDALASTFASFIAEGSPPEDAIRAGVINSGSVITVVDTQTGLLKRATLNERLAEARKSLPVRTWKL
jgi:ribokinase